MVMLLWLVHILCLNLSIYVCACGSILFKYVDSYSKSTNLSSENYKCAWIVPHFSWIMAQMNQFFVKRRNPGLRDFQVFDEHTSFKFFAMLLYIQKLQHLSRLASNYVHASQLFISMIASCWTTLSLDIPHADC